MCALNILKSWDTKVYHTICPTVNKLVNLCISLQFILCAAQLSDHGEANTAQYCCTLTVCLF